MPLLQQRGWFVLSFYFMQSLPTSSIPRILQCMYVKSNTHFSTYGALINYIQSEDSSLLVSSVVSVVKYSNTFQRIEMFHLQDQAVHFSCTA